MRAFFQQETLLSLNRRKRWSIDEISMEAILSIKKLKIEIRQVILQPATLA
jgi:hypothetical protein